MLYELVVSSTAPRKLIGLMRTEFENFGNMEASFFLEKLKRENIGHEIVTVIRSDG